VRLGGHVVPSLAALNLGQEALGLGFGDRIVGGAGAKAGGVGSGATPMMLTSRTSASVLSVLIWASTI